MSRLLVVNFHYIRNSFETPYPGIFGITPLLFEKQLEVLSTYGKFISQEELNYHNKRGSAIPEKSILITFDDGLAEQYDLALPILLRNSVPCVFFINTENIAECKVSLVHKIHQVFAYSPPDLFLNRCRQFAAKTEKAIDNITWSTLQECYPYDDELKGRIKYFLNYTLTLDEQAELISDIYLSLFSEQESALAEKLYMSALQLKHLSDLGMLGTHSHQHIALKMHDIEYARTNISKSINILMDITGKRPMSISYPYGSTSACNEETFQLSRSLGLELGFTMERKLNFEINDPLSIGRYDCNDVPGGKSPIINDDVLLDSASQSI